MELNEPNGTVAMTWEADGEEYQLVRRGNVPDTSEDAAHDTVAYLRELMNCSQLEAEHVYSVIMEDGEFIVSVQSDIDSLLLLGE